LSISPPLSLPLSLSLTIAHCSLSHSPTLAHYISSDYCRCFTRVLPPEHDLFIVQDSVGVRRTRSLCLPLSITHTLLLLYLPPSLSTNLIMLPITRSRFTCLLPPEHDLFIVQDRVRVKLTPSLPLAFSLVSKASALIWYYALTWYSLCLSPPRTHFEPWKAVGTRGRGSLNAR